MFLCDEVAALSGERRAVSLCSNYFYLRQVYHKERVCQLFFYLFYSVVTD
jgi:hypothetical protein